jgi:hypothetical protein
LFPVLLALSLPLYAIKLLFWLFLWFFGFPCCGSWGGWRFRRTTMDDITPRLFLSMNRHRRVLTGRTTGAGIRLLLLLLLSPHCDRRAGKARFIAPTSSVQHFRKRPAC